MEYEIIHLPKEKWKGTIIPIHYTTEKFYDVSVRKTDSGYFIEIEKKNFDKSVTRTQEENDYPDKLYQDHWQNAYAWGVVVDGELIAALETNPETWSNRLRITELWVHENHRRRGLGHELIEVAKQQAIREGRRALMLETQSCNVNAVDFYIHEGFELICLDTCCYNNNDLARKEVRLEFGWFPPKKKKLKREDIEIRRETEDDHYDVELMTQRAFWNNHRPGCDEHYLVHKLRLCEDYIPELSRIAVKDGKIFGCIMYSKSKVVDGENTHDVLTFGPLCVEPEWQGCNVGGMLLKETMEKAAEQGYKGIVIFGEPGYYPKFGFKTCDNFNITTSEGKNFDAFMAVELRDSGMENITGRFHASKVFENLPKEEVEEYNKIFPKLRKLQFPDQWD